MNKNGLLGVLLFCLIPAAWAQPVKSAEKFYTGGYLQFKSGSFIFEQPFIGGFNSTQFQNLDLNNDSVMDVVCFERTDNKVLPFLRIKGDQFRYAPEYEQRLPKGMTYYKTADLNSDGKLDIFTLDEGSNLLIYRNRTGVSDTFPRWDSLGQMYYRNQYAPGFPILYNGLALSRADYPEISDVDGDGDVDIVTYDQANQLYRMYSDVRSDFNWKKDTFEFQIMDICFGYFNDFNNTINLGDCPYKLKLKPRHVGGSSVLMFDNDQDGDKEMVLANIGVKHMTFVRNGKKDFSHAYDTMVAYDTIFPHNTTRACNYEFPAGFLVDINGDKINDLVTCPNGDANNPGNLRETNQLWYWRNDGLNNKPDFKFVKDNVFQEKTLDLGGKTAPAFADFDADGDMDLFIANDGDWDITHGFADRVALFKNVGTKDTAKFELQTTDYFALASRKMSDLIISFGDVDGDGDTDMLTGDRTGRVGFYKNSAGKGKPFNMVLADTAFLPPPSGFGTTYSAPAVFDYNHDSLPDLLVGYYYGGVKLYQNIGSKSNPQYELKPGNAWGMRANEWYFNDPDWTMLSFGNAVPVVADVDRDGNQDVLLGTSFGKFRLYHPAGRPLTDSLTADMGWLWQMSFGDSMVPDFGSRVVAAVASLDKDSIPELVIGNSRGGIHFAANRLSESFNYVYQKVPKPQFELYPNPGKNYLTVRRNANPGRWEIAVYNVLGQPVQRTFLLRGEEEITLDMRAQSNGVYLVEVTDGNTKTVKKFILQRD